MVSNINQLFVLPPRLPTSGPMVMAALAILFIYLFRRAYPKPIAGIPYNKSAGFFGDQPELLALRKAGKSQRFWFAEMAKRHNSAVTQIRLFPFSKPSVLLVDYRESYDILSRRNKEFDRSERSFNIFGTVVPNHHIAMKSSDPRFKGNKELNLWAQKATIAKGRPFAALHDMHEAALDIILAVAFGFGDNRSITKRHLNALSHAKPLDLLASADEPFVFPDSELPEEAQAVLIVVASLKAFATKDRLISDEITNAVRRLAEAGNREASAIDHMILREISAAKKAGRPPVFDSPRVRDEAMGYLIGGHDTSSTAAQQTLRRHLLAVYTDALAGRRQPNVQEITKLAAPYLDAFIEEILRLSISLPVMVRQAAVNTTILGHPVPKGTNLYIYVRGPSYTEPRIQVDDALRSETSQANRDRVGVWDERTIYEFEPMRWLKLKAGAEKQHGAQGKDVFADMDFDPQAGALLTFGAGTRGCFGRRLAYVEIRIMLVLLMWNFEFGTCAPELSGYDGFDG